MSDLNCYCIKYVHAQFFSMRPRAGAPRTYLDKLQRTQNKFLRIALNAPRDTKIEDLHKTAKIKSIDRNYGTNVVRNIQL